MHDFFFAITSFSLFGTYTVGGGFFFFFFFPSLSDRVSCCEPIINRIIYRRHHRRKPYPWWWWPRDISRYTEAVATGGGPFIRVVGTKTRPRCCPLSWGLVVVFFFSFFLLFGGGGVHRGRDLEGS